MFCTCDLIAAHSIETEVTVFNRDNLIEQLQQEIARLRMEIQRLIHEHQRIVDQLNEKIGELQVDLATKVLTDCIPYYNILGARGVCVCVCVCVRACARA
jgi:hypothetical protein